MALRGGKTFDGVITFPANGPSFPAHRPINRSVSDPTIPSSIFNPVLVDDNNNVNDNDNNDESSMDNSDIKKIK
ncbi:unnamed protein product [Brugia pahangi]|uniref:Serine/threonine-protein kinase n=1 Tax=Brugia pahangi TaxID=6280 RepID=A0A0N4TUD8_BRUPA|nr:unnamed protein product [Brugia pahangi]